MGYITAFRLIKADYHRYSALAELGGGVSFLKIMLLERGFRFTFWWRLAGVKSIAKPFFWMMYRHYFNKYGIQINTSTQIGGGFYIGHGLGVVINPTAVIGKNFTISQFCTIGSNKAHAATIGDNVYIAPHSCIIEDVKLGDHSTVGAGCVVTHDVPPYAVVAGVPARIIKYNNKV